jgi:hypothetical protein
MKIHFNKNYRIEHTFKPAVAGILTLSISQSAPWFPCLDQSEDLTVLVPSAYNVNLFTWRPNMWYTKERHPAFAGRVMKNIFADLFKITNENLNSSISFISYYVFYTGLLTL